MVVDDYLTRDSIFLVTSHEMTRLQETKINCDKNKVAKRGERQKRKEFMHM
jgi:hypothetical protein